jgi:hypothetical protein
VDGEQSLKNLRFIISAVGPVVFCLATFTPLASATEFQASGIFNDGALLGGTITIDGNAGMVTASNLTISGAGTFSTIVFQANLGPAAFYSVIADNSIGTEAFSFGILADSLVGFSGGDFCGVSNGNCFVSVYYPLSHPLNEISLSNGNLVGPSGVAPEPAAISFWGTVLAGSIMLYQYRRQRGSLIEE